MDAVTMGSDLYSTAIDASYFRFVSATCYNTAGTSPDGTLYLQLSNDNITWKNSAIGTATAATSGEETNILYQEIYEKWVRVFYDRTSGTAALTVAITLKG